MKEEQKVYIKGNQEKCDEVIKLLEDLGGYNSYSLDGHNSNNYYFIAPDGVIDYTCAENVAYSFLREFYKEISLERWKPEYNGCFYLINTTGEIIERIWVNSQFDKLSLEFGNCFRTKEEAEATRDKIKKMLNNKA